MEGVSEAESDHRTSTSDEAYGQFKSPLKFHFETQFTPHVLRDEKILWSKLNHLTPLLQSDS